MKKRKGDIIQKGFQASRTHVGAPKAELKAYDNNLTLADTTAGSFACVNDEVEGTSFFKRIGQRVYMKSLRLRGAWNAAASTPETLARLLIVYDSQCNQPATFTPNLVLQDANAGLATDVFSHINLNNRERYQIIRDKMFFLPSVTIAATLVTQQGPADYIKNSLNVDEYIKLDGLEALHTQTNAGTITDLTTGALIVFVIGGSSSNGNWTFTGRTRLRYYD